MRALPGRLCGGLGRISASGRQKSFWAPTIFLWYRQAAPSRAAKPPRPFWAAPQVRRPTQGAPVWGDRSLFNQRAPAAPRAVGNKKEMVGPTVPRLEGGFHRPAARGRALPSPPVAEIPRAAGGTSFRWWNRFPSVWGSRLQAVWGGQSLRRLIRPAFAPFAKGNSKKAVDKYAVCPYNEGQKTKYCMDRPGEPAAERGAIPHE